MPTRPRAPPRSGATQASRVTASPVGPTTRPAPRPTSRPWGGSTPSTGDVEVASFYALALLATHPPTDASLKDPTPATGILEPFYAYEPQPTGA